MSGKYFQILVDIWFRTAPDDGLLLILGVRLIYIVYIVFSFLEKTELKRKETNPNRHSWEVRLSAMDPK